MWPAPGLAGHASAPAKPAVAVTPGVGTEANGELLLRAGAVSATFDRANGMLRGMRNGNQTLALNNGPRLSFATPSALNPISTIQWLALASPAAGDAGAFDTAAPAGWTSSAATPALTAHLDRPRPADSIEITPDFPRGITWAGFKLELTSDGKSWKTIYDSSRRPIDGRLYEFPPQTVAAVRLSQFSRSDGQAVTIKTLRVGYTPGRYPPASNGVAKVTTGAGPRLRLRERQPGSIAWEPADSTHFRWTLQADGALRLDYEYTVNGEFSYYGISFDYPEENLRFRALAGRRPVSRLEKPAARFLAGRARRLPGTASSPAKAGTTRSRRAISPACAGHESKQPTAR